MKINWRWPATKKNFYVPWYVIAWRMVWALPIVICRVLLAACVLCSRGISTAAAIWHETR